MVFRLFWTLSRKSCIFTGKFFAGLSKLLFTCPKEHLKSKISEKKSWKLEDLQIIFELFGTIADNFFQCWQNSDICPREQFMGFFSKEKNSLLFRFWTNVYFQRKLSPELRNPQPMYLCIRGSFSRKTYFENYIIFHTSLDFDPKNA